MTNNTLSKAEALEIADKLFNTSYSQTDFVVIDGAADVIRRLVALVDDLEKALAVESSKFKELEKTLKFERQLDKFIMGGANNE